MAFQLGQFIAQLMGDNSHLTGAIAQAKAQFGGLGSAAQQVGGQQVGALGVPVLSAALGEATSAATTLGSALIGLAGINLSTILGLGSLVALAAGVGTATKQFMDLQDEMKNVQNRFRMLGMEAEANTQRFWAFGKQMSETFGMGQAEARKMALEMMQKGLDPSRYQEMTRSAVQLGEALGIGSTQANRVVQQLEAGNYQILRRMHPAFRQLLDQGAGRLQIEQKVNEFIAMGGVLAQERANSFGMQFKRLQNSFVDLGVAVSNAIGPAFAPIVSMIADAVGRLARNIEEWVTSNKEAIGTYGLLIAKLLAGLAVFNYLGPAIGAVTGALGYLVPGLGMVGSLLGGLGGFSPFAMLSEGLSMFTGALSGLWGMLSAGFMSVVSLIMNPMEILYGLGSTILSVFSGLLGGVGTMASLAAGAVTLLTTAVTFLMSAIGIGLLIGFVGALAGAEDTFGSTESAAKGLGETLKGIWDGLMEFVGPVLEWLQTEVTIVFKALVAAARQTMAAIKEGWDWLMGALQPVFDWLYSAFKGVLDWLESTFGITLGSVGEMWSNLTAEIAVLGLRIKQVVLMIAIAIMSIPTIAMWLGDVFKALGEWFYNNWTQFFVEGAKTVISAFQVVGAFVQDVGESIRRALSGEGFSFDTAKTQEAMGQLSEQASKVFAGLEMPHLDLSNVAPELQAQLGAVGDQIAAAKDAARAAQDKDRTNRQNRASGSTAGGPMNAAGVRIGGRDKAHFTDPVAFWKKLQEAAASQRVEYVMQQQLATQQEMVRVLNEIYRHQTSTRPAPPSGGVVPR